MATAAQKQRQRSHKGRQRKDDLKNYWLIGERPLRYGDDEWRVMALRGKGVRPFDVSDYVEQINWTDASALLAGSVTLRKPDAAKLALGEGDLLRLDWRRLSSTKWTELWRMRVGGPQDSQSVQINVKDNAVQYQLATDLALAQKSTGTFKYHKDKRHPKGWRVSQVIVDVCNRWHIPFWPIPRMSHLIKKATRTQASPVDFMQSMVAQHNNYEHGDYILRWRQGRLEVVRKQRSPHMLTISGTMIDATLTRTRRSDFATQLEVTATPDKATGRDAKGKKKVKKRKITTTITKTTYVRRFGLIKRAVRVHADSVAEARRKGTALLTKLLKPQQEVTFTHPGIPTLLRNHALTVALPDYGYRKLLYVASVNHTVTPGDYTMDVTVRTTDPFEDKKKKVKQKKRDAATRRRRKQPGGKTDPPKSKKHRQRSSSGGTHTPQTRNGRTPGQQLSDRAYR